MRKGKIICRIRSCAGLHPSKVAFIRREDTSSIIVGKEKRVGSKTGMLVYLVERKRALLISVYVFPICHLRVTYRKGG